jgi:tricorn protease
MRDLPEKIAANPNIIAALYRTVNGGGMKRIRLVLALFLVWTATSLSVDIHDTKLLTQPAISKTHIVFAYAGDLWTANLDGKGARQLTADTGIESNPVFSPDGRLVAFSGQYDGNTDAFVVPVEGGVPKRLTWHPGPDMVQGFTPDGSAVLFTSPRAVFTGRYTQLFTVPVDGGFPEALKLPNASRATYSPDGARIAYSPLQPQFAQWKNYRGGTVSTISLFTLSDNSVEKIPQPQTKSNDADPLWMADKVYFRSDRNGEFNIFSYDVKTRAIRQLTQHADFPVLSASAGAGVIIYEQAGSLHLLDPDKGRTTRITVGVPADLVATRPRYVKGNRYIRHGAISPTGARAVFEFRGEIVTVPAEKGDPRNLTNTKAAHERSPVWSPDGKSIAYFSDEGGEYKLHVRNQDGNTQARRYELTGAGFYDTPTWSPDSQKIAFADNSWSLYWIDLKTGGTKKVASEHLYGPSREETIWHSWSPDSKWIVYTVSTRAYIQSVYAYSVEENKSYPITDGLSEVSEPVFDQSGKYLFFFGSTDAGPEKDWFAQSTADSRATESLYVAVLRKDLPSPLAKESDEEKGAPNADADVAKDAAKDASKDAAKDDDQKTSTEAVRIDFADIQNRILSIPIPVADYTNLRTGAAGQIYYLERLPLASNVQGNAPRGTLHHYDLNTRKDEVLMTAVDGFDISSDKKKILYRARGEWSIVGSKEKAPAGQGKLRTDAIEVHIDPRAEWNQIFDEAWRINRDYFYATNMHGVDWNAAKKKYEVFLPHIAARNDLNRIIQWMSSELSVGHHRVAGGDQLYETKVVPGGLLGADYAVENGRYRFKKVYGGLNFNPGLRSPLTEPGVDVKAGDYLLAVRGLDLRPPTSIYSLFENTADKLIDITVASSPDGSNARTVRVVPIASEAALRNRDWVEGNLKKVDQATGGRVAYVYVPDTAGTGFAYFKRYFYPQSYKEAIIVDERFNGGGQIADYYIDILRRPFIANWAMRYGEDLKTPSASIQGPKVMLIDETAGSGGDLLPWMFRKFKMGTLVGKTTWGGLVGTLGFPVLMDGGTVTAPNLAIWTDEGWVVENAGVAPDIEVEQTPADVIAGRDPQLEKAIQIILDELKKTPPAKPTRPAFPVRIRK